MSDLQKAYVKSRLSAGVSPDAFDEREEQDSYIGDLPEIPIEDDSSSASSASSTGTIIPSPSRNLFARPEGVPRGRTLSQIPWTTYFERELSVKASGGDASSPTIHAYLTSPVGKGPLFVMHHGAGSSGLSFAVISSEIRKRVSAAGILSHDARGHGQTTAPGGDELDLSLTTLSNDLLTVITETKSAMHWQELPPMILVGHSLGGAVVTELAKSGALGNALLGYAVLDVVEGSAIDALQSMQTYLSTRPTGFATVEAGIEWHIRSRTVRNAVSARTSVPALLSHSGKEGDPRPWKWRTDLGKTQPFWENWFVGLSKKFLGARGGKLLLLAGTDRLDTELTIGQMQGIHNAFT
ncbi:Protein phosphatase methylesterase 1 [Pestalotiopsis sp. IQ-011]